MKRDFVKLAILGVVLAIGGFLFAWSGLFNIAASSGHWAITEWFLHFTMRQSVETHSMWIEVPDLADPALVAKGAGHFEAGCVPCHGKPETPPNPVARAMTPAPPHLVHHVAGWEPNELFWIVKHGVKYTGMPAWPARHRDDEVWAMTAFLLQLPELDPQAYHRLAFGRPAETPRVEPSPVPQDRFDKALATCARCHGADGRGRGLGAFPILAGQSESYLAAALASYARGARPSGMMQLATAGLDEATRRALARHYGADAGGAEAGSTALRRPERRGSVGGSPDPALIEQGEKIASRGDPRSGVPPCASCHGPAETPRRPIYPVLAGQYRDYLARQLELFREGVRGGSPYSHIMTTIAKRLDDAQVDAVAAYYANLNSGERMDAE